MILRITPGGCWFGYDSGQTVPGTTSVPIQAAAAPKGKRDRPILGRRDIHRHVVLWSCIVLSAPAGFPLDHHSSPFPISAGPAPFRITPSEGQRLIEVGAPVPDHREFLMRLGEQVEIQVGEDHVGSLFL